MNLIIKATAPLIILALLFAACNQNNPKNVEPAIAENIECGIAAEFVLGEDSLAIDLTVEQTDFFSQLADSALTLTKQEVRYDPSYVRIAYPNGDVPADRGVCTDVVIRAYRKLGIDLQKEVHEDMKAHFDKYPKTWGLKEPDPNIDHRRVPNLMVFFSRSGAVKNFSESPSDFQPGDIVCWDLNGRGLTHIGIVSKKKSKDGERNMIIHNIGGGQVLEDCLFNWEIIGHYRYAQDNKALNDKKLSGYQRELENQCDTYYLNKIIANVYKYRDEDRLFENIEKNEWGYPVYSCINMSCADTILVINFEQGTVKKVKRSSEYTGYWIKGFPTEFTVTGDFNGDGNKETSIIENFEYLRANHIDTVFNLGFSDKSIPNLPLFGSMNYTIKNEKNLLNDGKDLIGFMPACGSGRFYHVYSLKDNEWVELVCIQHARDMVYTGIIPIEKDPIKENHILIRYAAACSSNCCVAYVIEVSIKVEDFKRGIGEIGCLG